MLSKAPEIRFPGVFFIVKNKRKCLKIIELNFYNLNIFLNFIVLKEVNKSRQKMKKYFETNQIPDSTHIAVELFYSKGGYNYFTGKQESRGVWLSLRPVTYEVKDGYTSESYMGFSGIKFLIKEMARKNQKQIDRIENELKNIIDDLVFHYEAGHQYQLVKGIDKLKALV